MRTTTTCLLAFTITACTPLDAREASKPNTDNGTDATVKTAQPAPTPKPQPEPEPKPDPVPEPTTVKVAIASVTLDQDCADPVVPVSPERSIVPPQPPDDVPEPPGVVAPAMPAKRGPPRPLRPGESMAVGYEPPCAQSMLQVRFTNVGKDVAGVRIASIQLHDVASKGVLAPVTARLPSMFDPTGVYTPWDERIGPGVEIAASYRLAPPSWSVVDGKLGAGNSSRDRELELEVTVEIDGKPTTVRSPAFRRPPEIIMPPT